MTLPDALTVISEGPHELHVIDHDEVYPILGSQPTRLASQLSGAQGLRIVDNNLVMFQFHNGILDTFLLFRRELPGGTQPTAIQQRTHGNETSEQFHLAHFHAEHGHACVVVESGIVHTRKRKARFASAWATGKDKHILRLEPAQHEVQQVKAGRDATNLTTML